MFEFTPAIITTNTFYMVVLIVMIHSIIQHIFNWCIRATASDKILSSIISFCNFAEILWVPILIFNLFVK